MNREGNKRKKRQNCFFTAVDEVEEMKCLSLLHIEFSADVLSIWPISLSSGKYWRRLQ